MDAKLKKHIEVRCNELLFNTPVDNENITSVLEWLAVEFEDVSIEELADVLYERIGRV